MNLLIVAGGGGHFAPALAVIQKLPKSWDMLVVGRKYTFEADKTLSFEYQTARNLGINFKSITTGRLQREFSLQSLNLFLKMPIGVSQAIRVIKEYKPDVVLSFGGYISIPVCLAAKLFNIPIIVHEQTLRAGLANKIVGKFADKVCISWEESRRHFPQGKVVLTGNPIRQISNSKWLASQRGEQIANGQRPIIYITGGSGGAHAINVLIENIIEQLLDKYIVIHQTGDAKEYGDFDRLTNKKEELQKELQKRYYLTKFINADRVFSVLKKVDLIVARSGINTVSELLSFGKPALFIPLPYGQHNEQLTNALFVQKIGLAEIAEQKDLTPEKLFFLINNMLENIDNYTKNSKKAKELIKKDAADKIISIITHVSKQKKT